MNFNNLYIKNITLFPQPVNGISYYSKKTIDYKNIELDFIKIYFSNYKSTKGYSFEPFQLPMLNGRIINDFKILNEKLYIKLGIVIESNLDFTIISTIDYLAKLYHKKV